MLYMDPKVINFAKFNGGIITKATGELVELTNKVVIIDHEGDKYQFRRDPGPKAGYGIGPAKNWRLAQEERREYCFPDLPTRRK